MSDTFNCKFYGDDTWDCVEAWSADAAAEKFARKAYNEEGYYSEGEETKRVVVEAENGELLLFEVVATREVTFDAFEIGFPKHELVHP